MSAQPPVAGPARALAALYAIFALAAGARSAVQLAAHAGRAPLAYALSAIAAGVYLVATVALRRSGRRARRIALAACAIELAGVLLVGTATVVAADLFPDETVWTRYGQGYGHLPVVLPLLGLGWLAHAGSRRASRAAPG